MRCTVCPTTHVPNSIFCDECGVYLLKRKELGTDPLDIRQPIRLRIASQVGTNSHARELQVSLIKPIHLGRIDPTHDIFPEIDLTQDLGREQGVSREHTRIFQQGDTVKMEDLGSTNGTLLNGVRLDPYMSETLRDGDQFQMGELLIEVSFEP